MATIYKIHPAIGIARVGNSPDEFFIGPERPGEVPAPPGGFKDAQCRVKRQAARFRIFAYDDHGTVTEVTDADAEIAWTVHLVNKKAANPGRGNTEPAPDLTIDPGARTLTGPDQRQRFDTGSIRFADQPAVVVPLGEIRSDDDGRLLVLGGAGRSASPGGTGIGDFWASPGWYDDVSDGPVTATIRLRATGETPAVAGAWVIVTPPKFAPQLDSVVTLYDRLFETMVDAGFATSPTTTSYTRDVYPILQRARTTRYVQDVGPIHAWADPVMSLTLRTTIFNKLRAPSGGGGNMPALNESSTNDGRLTPTQYAHMQRWRDDSYANDWVGPPPPAATITPEGLDRAALEACVGGAFFPGIEAGGLTAAERPLLVAGHYSEAFRLNHSIITPGDITFTMALPWQADFSECGESWWPVPRPNDVTPAGTTVVKKWDRGAEGGAKLVNLWHTLGFVVRQGDSYVEVDRCDTATITLLTPLLHFQDVPQGPMGMVREVPLAITFEVVAPTSAVTLEYAPGGAPAHPQLVAYNTSASVGPTGPSGVATARLWIIYRTGAAGEVLPAQTVRVRQATTGQAWTIEIIGNTVARRTAAAALVLDRSGSMAQDRGDGQSKHAALQQAAATFVDVMLEGDGVAVVRFNQDAQVLQPVLPLGAGGLSDTSRGATRDLINGTGLDPAGETSIGDGIAAGRGALNAAAAPYDVRALVVLTDGVENHPRFIADVAADINERTYAVGLGLPQNISVPALQTISGNHGGFLLITGAIDRDNRFLLQKYFLQILAGISNADVVLDPAGELLPGRVQRVPFQLTQGDAGVDVILLTPDTQIVDFRLQTPGGMLIEPWRARSEPGMRFVRSDGVTYYRLVLPTELARDRFEQGGTWHALLRLGRPRIEPPKGEAGVVDLDILRGDQAPSGPPRSWPGTRAQAARAAMLAAETPDRGAVVADAVRPPRPVPYSLVVHAYSSISLRASAAQSSREPGARIDLSATLTQSGLPFREQARVWAEVRRPDGSTTTIDLAPRGEDYAGSCVATTPGVYAFRVRARGQTSRGESFTRERALTAAVWLGGDRDGRGGSDGLVEYLRERDERLCELLRCLSHHGGPISRELEARLHALGLDLARARQCLQLLCPPGKSRGRG